MTNRNVPEPKPQVVEVFEKGSERVHKEANVLDGISKNVSEILERGTNVGNVLGKLFSHSRGKLENVEDLFPLLYEEEELLFSIISGRLRETKRPPHNSHAGSEDRSHLLKLFRAYAELHPSPEKIKDCANGNFLVEEAVLFSLDDLAKTKELLALFGLAKESFDIENVLYGLKFIGRYHPEHKNFNEVVEYFGLEKDPRVHEIALGYGRLATEDMEESHQRILKAIRDLGIPKAAAIVTLHTFTTDGFLTPNIKETFTPRQKHGHDGEYMRDFFRILMHKLDLTDEEEDEITKGVLKSAMFSYGSLAFGSLYIDITFWKKGRKTEYEKWIADARAENPDKSVNKNFHAFAKSALGTDVSITLKDGGKADSSKCYAEWAVFSDIDEGTAKFCESLSPTELENFLIEGIETVFDSSTHSFNERESFDKIRAFVSAFEGLKNVSKNPVFANLMAQCHLRYGSESGYVPVSELFQELATDLSDEKIRDGWLAFFKKTLNDHENILEHRKTFEFCSVSPEGLAILDLKEAYRNDEQLRRLVDNSIKYHGVETGSWGARLYGEFGKAGRIAEWFGVNLKESGLRHFVAIND